MSTRAKKVFLFGFGFHPARHVAEVAAEIIQDMKEHTEVAQLITPNASQIVYYNERRHRALKDFYMHCRYILPDGMPIVWLSRLKRTRALHRLTGSDLFPKLWRYIVADQSESVFVLANEEIARKFGAEHPECHFIIPHMFGADDETYINELAAEVATAVNATNSKFVFLGLGYPKQEKLGMAITARLEEGLDHPVLILLLGASFEFYFGMKPRAPQWMRRNGLEWLHRFMQEPLRLWKRYTIDNFRFVMLALQELLRRTKDA